LTKEDLLGNFSPYSLLYYVEVAILSKWNLKERRPTVIKNSRNLPVLVEEEVPDLIELDPDGVLVPRSEARRLDQIFSHHERFICCSDSQQPLICAATVLHGKSKAFHHPWIPILNKYPLKPIFSANDH